MLNFLKRAKNRRFLDRLIAAFSDKAETRGVSLSEVTQFHRLKIDLSGDEEQRLQSLQTLANLNDRAFLLLALRELVRRVQSEGLIDLSEDELIDLSMHVDILLRLIGQFGQASVNQELDEWVYLSSAGIPSDRARVIRPVAARVYLSHDDPRESESVLSAWMDFSRSLGFELSTSLPATGGSWFKKLFVRTKDALTRDEVRDRLKKGERALELVALHERQAQIDNNLAQAAATLVSALDGVPEGACQLGSLVVVKHHGVDGKPRLLVRQLTQDQLIELESTPDLMTVPAELFGRLTQGDVEERDFPERRDPEGS